MIGFILGFFVSGVIEGFLAWAIWSYYWNVHLTKTESMQSLKRLRSFIVRRKVSMLMLSITVVSGYMIVLSKIFGLSSTLVAGVTIAILETIVIMITAPKKERETKGSVITNFITMLFMGVIASSGFFFIANYVASLLYLLLIIVPVISLMVGGFVMYRNIIEYQQKVKI